MIEENNPSETVNDGQQDYWFWVARKNKKKTNKKQVFELELFKQNIEFCFTDWHHAVQVYYMAG